MDLNRGQYTNIWKTNKVFLALIKDDLFTLVEQSTAQLL